jgi:hypothetical protein
MESEFDGRSFGYSARNESIDFSSNRVGNIAQWCRDTFESSFPTTLVWIVGTSVIVGFLTAMLIVGIAITV